MSLLGTLADVILHPPVDQLMVNPLLSLLPVRKSESQARITQTNRVIGGAAPTSREVGLRAHFKAEEVRRTAQNLQRGPENR